jgi:2-iminobutanoate/2-iminopropanoate deaminase
MAAEKEDDGMRKEGAHGGTMGSPVQKSVVRTEKAPAPFQGAPYSQAIRTGHLVFVSGQLALEPGHTEIVGDTIQEQTEQVFRNLAAILEEAGSGVDRLVKTTVFLVDLGDFQGMNEVYARWVGDKPPARATVEISSLPSGALVEIEAIAITRET